MPDRTEDTERKRLTPLTEAQAEAKRREIYADVPPATERQYSDHKITTELFGCSINGDEIVCSFRVEGYLYRPEARAKVKDGAKTLTIRIPAEVHKRDGVAR